MRPTLESLEGFNWARFLAEGRKGRMVKQAAAIARIPIWAVLECMERGYHGEPPWDEIFLSWSANRAEHAGELQDMLMQSRTKWGTPDPAAIRSALVKFHPEHFGDTPAPVKIGSDTSPRDVLRGLEQAAQELREAMAEGRVMGAVHLLESGDEKDTKHTKG